MNFRSFKLGSKPAKPAKARSPNVNNFLIDFSTLARPVNDGCYAFPNATGGFQGFVQFIISSDRSLQIHRLWTLNPGEGNGSNIIRALCELADRHYVDLKLKVIPIGRKPHPLSREQLKSWYQRHGFEGTRWLLQRKPIPSTTP